MNEFLTQLCEDSAFTEPLVNVGRRRADPDAAARKADVTSVSVFCFFFLF